MTTNRIWLGSIAALSIAACSSKDPLLNGNGGGGAGGSGTHECNINECLRPYECIRTCGGPIEYTSCCMCSAPLFDNFECGGSSGRGGTGGTAGAAGRGGTGGAAGAGGTSGAAGRGGTGGAAGTVGGAPGGRGGAGGASGTGGTAGAGGTSGAAGRGGTGGAAGTVGGAPGGRGGAGGTGGAAGTGGTGGTGGRVDGGADARLCESVQCIRPYECIRACGGPIVYSGCCACEAPLFDNFGGMACGDGGTGAISYVGCRFIGGIDRIVVAKRDTSRNMCVNVVFANGTSTPGLTLPSGYRLESAQVVLPSECPTRNLLSVGAGTVTGTATWAPLGNPSAADVDLVVELPTRDEALIARNVDVMPACP